MNSVEPIRDPNKIEDILIYLEDKNERDYILFLLGIYTALRISDIVQLQVKQVRNLKEIKTKEKKTNKTKTIELNSKLVKALKKYIEEMNDYEYLVYSTSKNKNKPLSRQQAYNVIKGACNKFGLYNVGTHTMRKTFGYHFYKKTKDLALLQDIFNHSHPSITLKYIGINSDSISNAYKNMKYF